MDKAHTIYNEYQRISAKDRRDLRDHRRDLWDDPRDLRDRVKI